MIKLKDLLTEAPKIKKVKNLSVQYMDAEFVGDVDFRPVRKAWVYKKDKPKLKLVSSNKKDDVSSSKMTAKQIGFCKDVVNNGMTLIDAYRNNYNVSPDIKSNTLRMLASRLRSRDNIGIFINQLIKDKENRKSQPWQIF